jgi:hypothetical protein
MLRSAFRHLRFVGPLTVAATLGIGALPALAQTEPVLDCSAIRFELANPTAGSRIEPGGYVLQGIAVDSRAQQGTGIDRIDFFLDSRDQGGMNIGMAVPNPVTGPFGADSFTTTLSLPNMVGGHDLFGYAHSSVTGQEIVIAVPVVIGEDPSKAGPASSTTAMETCIAMTGTTPAPTTVTTAPPPAMPAEVQPAASTPASTSTTPVMSPAAESIHLDVGNPSPGATIHVGGLIIEGVAFDREAESGTGVDRIQVFLDNRDNAGVLLGEAVFGDTNVFIDNGDDSLMLVGGEATSGENMWRAMLNLPSNANGAHTLFVYAHSAITGAEHIVMIPVIVAP